jgi:hypothetical protein
LNIARDYFSLLFYNTLYVTKEQTKKKEEGFCFAGHVSFDDFFLNKTLNVSS